MTSRTLYCSFCKHFSPFLHFCTRISSDYHTYMQASHQDAVAVPALLHFLRTHIHSRWKMLSLPPLSPPPLSLSLSPCSHVYAGVVRTFHRVRLAATLVASMMLRPVIDLMSSNQLAAGLPRFRFPSTLHWIIDFCRH